MPSVTPFDSTKKSLQELVKDINEGKIQLPDFQRGWIWDDEHIRSLLASVSQGYPIGAVMTLETGGADIRFKARLIEGVEMRQGAPSPERLVMDGQQRLTSLFQALYMGKPVDTRDARRKAVTRWYYVNIATALSTNGDREDAVASIPGDRIVKNFRGEAEQDYSSLEKETAAGFFPLRLVFDIAGLNSWQMSYLGQDQTRTQELMATWNRFFQEVVQPFQQYQIPVIVLRRETTKEAVCQVFEKVNTGGVQLTVFELLTATFAVDDFNLRDDWTTRLRRLKERKLLANIQSTDFLQAVTLLASRKRRLAAQKAGLRPDQLPGITCKKKDVLRLTLAEYKEWADAITGGFLTAAQLLHSQCLFSSKDLPYRTQFVPLAAILTVLGPRADNDAIRAKLIRWYWCGVFGELYGGTTETRFANDLAQVLAWIEGGEEPATVTDATFSAARLLSMRTRNSAAYKGVYALLMRDGCRDFHSGERIDIQAYFDNRIDIHHVFPRAWCGEREIDNRKVDSIINKTPLSARTNRMIGGKGPSDYLPRIARSAELSPDRMADILRSHALDPQAMRTDDFDRFAELRAEALCERIAQAIGKDVLWEKTAEVEALLPGIGEEDELEEEEDVS